MYYGHVVCEVTYDMGMVFNTWDEVEEVLDALNAFMRSLARPSKGLEDYGDTALFSIGGGDVVIGMTWGLENGRYVLEWLSVWFNEKYCTNNHCRAVYNIGREYSTEKYILINRGLERIAGSVEVGIEATRYVVGGLVITLGWAGNTLREVSFEAECPPPGNAGV